MLKAEYQALDIPVNEEKPYVARERLIAKAGQYLSGSSELKEIVKKDGVAAAIKHARGVLAKDKNNHFLRAELARLLDNGKYFAEAIVEWRRVVRQFPGNTYYQTSFAWSMVKRLTELNKTVTNDKEHVERIINFFKQIDLLNAIEKPSRVYSLYLSHCTASCNHFIETKNKAIAEAYLELVNTWGLENLLEEDFKVYEPEPGKTFPSLCEKIIKALYHSLNISTRFAHAKWVSDFIGANFERYPEQQWFPFYYGKVLLWAGESDKAREYLLKTVRLKRDEFWAWAILAETFENDHQKALASLCRALLCKTKNEGFIVNVHEQLGILLRKLDEGPAARYEFSCVDRIRAERNWTAINRTQEFNDWLHSGEKATSNDAMYKKYASLADALVFGDLPTIKAILECIQTIDNNKGGKRIAIIGFFRNGNYESNRFSGTKRFPFLEKKPDGAPLNIQIELINNVSSIVNISERSDGKLWDICPGKIAVISAVDTGKGHTIATFERGKICRIDHKRLPTAKSWAPGTVVELKMRHNKEHDHYSAFYGVTTKLPPPRELCKSFSGPLRVSGNGTFAFVGDVFIDPIMFASLGTMRSGTISGLAVVSLDRKKGKLGWKAITVEK
jgi:tetratricopeptide (TPR) repeat protein